MPETLFSLTLQQPFWNSWTEVTPSEEQKISAVKDFQSFLQKQFPNNEITAYVGGSFVRREYADNSDIDFWIVAKRDQLEVIKETILKYLEAHPQIKKALDHDPSFREYEKVMGIGEKVDAQFRGVQINGAYLVHGKALPPIDMDAKFYRERIDGMLKMLQQMEQEGRHPWIQNIAKFLLYIRYFELLINNKVPEQPYSFKVVRDNYPEESLTHQVAKIMLSKERTFTHSIEVQIKKEIEKLNQQYV